MMKLKADNRIFQTIQKSCNLMNLIKKYNEFESIYNFKNLLFAQNEYINVKYLIIVFVLPIISHAIHQINILYH